MTLEFSLRQRAKRARCYATAWLSIAVIVLMGTYVSLPSIAAKTLYSINQIENTPQPTISTAGDLSDGKRSVIQLHVFALTMLALGLCAVSISCYLLGRTACVEVELATRLNGIADALCLSGGDFERLEKAVGLLVPKTRFLSAPEFSSVKELQQLTETVKKLRE